MSKLVPKLRFKEFSREWEENKVPIKIISGNNYTLDSYDDSNGILLIQGLNISPNKLILDKPIYISKNTKIENHVIIKKDDILIGLNRPIIDNKLKICLFDKKEAYLYQRAGVLKFDREKLLNSFLFYYLSSNIFLEQLLLELVGSDQPYIKSDLFKKTKNIFPNNLKEQQKIANTLSSLDSLIEATSKKVEALKKHKKGLMQKLFPKEGKKEPELRFGEFSGEWEEKSIDELFDYKNGGSFEKYIIEKGDYNLITLNSIDIHGELKREHKTIGVNSDFLNKHDLVMVLSDVAHGNFLGLVAIIPEDNKYILNQRMGALRLKTNDNIKFIRLFINLHQKYFKLHGHGSSQQNLSKGDILKFIIKIPHPKEQQKIANTLSSLDSLIEATSKKVEALKKHKKGLMQQMFMGREE